MRAALGVIAAAFVLASGCAKQDWIDKDAGDRRCDRDLGRDIFLPGFPVRARATGIDG